MLAAAIVGLSSLEMVGIWAALSAAYGATVANKFKGIHEGTVSADNVTAEEAAFILEEIRNKQGSPFMSSVADNIAEGLSFTTTVGPSGEILGPNGDPITDEEWNKIKRAPTPDEQEALIRDIEKKFGKSEMLGIAESSIFDDFTERSVALTVLATTGPGTICEKIEEMIMFLERTGAESGIKIQAVGPNGPIPYLYLGNLSWQDHKHILIALAYAMGCPWTQKKYQQDGDFLKMRGGPTPSLN